MTSRLLQFVLALILCVALVPGVFAKGGHGNGHGGDKQDKHGDKDRDGDSRADRDHDRDGDRDRDGDDKRPAGWSKGKKTGWGDCDVPPGQVKKLGCHPGSKHHVTRTHDRDRAVDRDRDRDRHTSVANHSTTAGTVKTTTKVPAQTREQARRTGGKIYNDDGTWHYGSNKPATTTATKK